MRLTRGQRLRDRGNRATTRVNRSMICQVGAVTTLLLALSACAVDPGPVGIGTPSGGERPDDAATTDVGATPEAPDLTGGTFVSSTISGHVLVENSAIQMTFEGEQLSVQAGCNTIFGAYALEEGVLRVAELGQTEMGCTPELMEQDTWLIAFLQAAPDLRETEDGFVLSSGGVELELTDRKVASPDLALEGPTWVLTTSYTDTATTNIRGMENASLVFDSGDIQLDTGCNTGGGSYTVDGDTLALSPLRLTLRACEEPVREVEEVLVAVLNQQDLTVEIEGDTLKLTAPDGTALGFTAPSEAGSTSPDQGDSAAETTAP